MRKILDDLRRNLIGIWTRLDGGQRLVVGAVLAAAAVGLVALLWFASQPTYVTVLTAQTGEELRAAKRVLAQAGVPFLPDETGRSLRVERRLASAAESALFESGQRGGGDPELPATSIIEDADTRLYRLDQAARSQAERAIGSLAGVQSAIITASRPRRTPFRDRDHDAMPRATVALRLQAGTAFEPVARSAASLAAAQLTVPLENIEVYDAVTHQRWHYDPDREAGGGSSEFLAQQRALAAERTHLAQEALDAIYPGKTVVTVGVELDPEWEIRNEKVLPAEPLVRSDLTTRDASETHDRPAAGGDPSTTAGAPEAGAARSTTRKETRDRQFVTDVGERRSGRLAPEIKRLTVALLYDRSLERPGFDKQQLVSVVKSIVGWDPQRDGRDGDSGFSTLSGDFPAADPPPAAVAPAFGAVALRWAPVAGQVLGVVLVLFFLRSLLQRPVRTGRAAAAPSPAAGAQPEEADKRMRREIERAIADDPAALARMLETWLTEQKS